MRYQYKSQGFKQDFYGMKNNFNWSPVSIIIILNILIYLFSNSNAWNIHQLFGVSNQNFKIWQPFTYMFFHGGPMHLFFNMFLLWMFGKKLEFIWGTIKFIKYYLFTGIGAGLLIYFFSDAVTIGASGAIMAILFAYGYIYPNQQLFFWFIPMKAKYAILILIIMELSQELARNPLDNVSHIGHLGGMLIGFLYLKYGENFSFIKIKRVSRTNKEMDIDNHTVDQILDKIKRSGWEGLTEKEKSTLFQASQKRSQDKHLN
tara:strand:- start:1043 stop:1822 length:780 start_codon:yes stop_codon:yes gene_type:complete